MIRRRGDAWEVRVYAGLDPQTGRKRWLSRSVPAKPAQKTPPRSARDLEARLTLEVRQGQHVPVTMTVAELLDHWLADVDRELSPWTLHGYRSLITRYIGPALGATRIDKVTAALLDRTYRQLQASGGRGGRPLAGSTVRHCHAVLHRAFDDAERYGWIVKNPCDRARPPKAEVRTVSTPDRVDVDRLLAAARDPDLALFVLLAAATGARRGEVCGLRWGDVKATRDGTGTITIARSIADPGGDIVVKTPKTGKQRRLAVGPGVMAALEERRQRARTVAKGCRVKFAADGYVLASDPAGAEPWRPELASKRFARLAEVAGVDCTLHSLRHAHVTELLGAGLSVRDVADRVGHASPRMTLEVYGHAIPAADQKAAQVTDRGIRPDRTD